MDADVLDFDLMGDAEVLAFKSVKELSGHLLLFWNNIQLKRKYPFL